MKTGCQALNLAAGFLFALLAFRRFFSSGAVRQGKWRIRLPLRKPLRFVTAHFPSIKILKRRLSLCLEVVRRVFRCS